MAWAASRAISPVAGEALWFSSLRLGVALAQVAGASRSSFGGRIAAASAREEQRLEQLADDLKWANRIVGAMLEWRNASGSGVPLEVLRRLTERYGSPQAGLEAL